LVDLVSELCANTPLTEMPNKERVDAAVSHYVGTQYNTTIQSTTGPTAIGAYASATAGVSIEDVIGLLDALSAEATNASVGDEAASTELLAAIEDLRFEVSRGSEADAGEVMKKAGKLRTLAGALGSAGLTALVSGSLEAVATLAMNGAFG